MRIKYTLSNIQFDHSISLFYNHICSFFITNRFLFLSVPLASLLLSHITLTDVYFQIVCLHQCFRLKSFDFTFPPSPHTFMRDVWTVTVLKSPQWNQSSFLFGLISGMHSKHVLCVFSKCDDWWDLDLNYIFLSNVQKITFCTKTKKNHWDRQISWGHKSLNSISDGKLSTFCSSLAELWTSRIENIVTTSEKRVNLA